MGDGKLPVELERIIWIYGVANWFNLGNIAGMDALCVPVIRESCRIDLGRERTPIDVPTRTVC